jgi:deoxyribodipyrimidine photo-lyase
MKKRILVWFKSDLRLLDNEVLWSACRDADEIIPVVCIDPRQFEPLPNGLRKTGFFRTVFYLECIQQLKEQLQKKGGDLVVLQGSPEVEIPAFAQKYGVKAVYAKKEIAPEEIAMDAAVEKALWKNEQRFEVFSTSTLYHAVDLPFGIKDIPDVFTSFRKRIEREALVRDPFPIPEMTFTHVPATKIPTSIDLGVPSEVTDERRVMDFKGGELEGLDRLNHYVFESQAVQTYKQTRNGLLGQDYSTKFSPWLSFGCLSPKWIYHEIKRFESEKGANDSTYWVVFELLWRDYFRFMMKKYGNKFFLLNGWKNGNDVPAGHDQTLFDNWVNGMTGDDFVDANMRELKHTGFMSNRGRQNVASYFVHQLQLDWRMGARYFEQQLIDYDVSNNWGNWMYVAGVGNDPRENRMFNVQKQAQQYDPNEKYRKIWLMKS